MVDKKNLNEIGILFFFIAIDIGLTYYGLTKGGGAESSGIIQKVGVYGIAWAGGLLLLMTAKIGKSLDPKNPFFSQFKIFEPENSQLGNLKKWMGTPLKMILVSLIIFGIIGLLSVNSNTFFTEAGLGEQQVTNTARVLDGAFPSANAETFALLGLFFIGLGLIKSRFNGKWELPLVILLLILLTGGWITYHSFVYGTDQVSILYTGMFGFAGLLITYLTFTIIPFTIWHILNNVFIKLNEFANDAVVGITTGIIIVILLIWYIQLVKNEKSVPRALR